MQRGLGQRSTEEIIALYGTGAWYGVGVGVWLSLEAEVTDPGLFIIAPAVTGIAAPVGVYLADQPAMPEGLPGAISAGLVVGGGFGMGIWSVRHAASDPGDKETFTAFMRSTTLGATLGGVAGGFVGYYLEPPPESSVLVTSGSLWGTAAGAAFGFGASGDNPDDTTAVGSFVGFGVGLAAAGGLTAVWVPDPVKAGWMWAGAGIGAVASTPIFLAYIGDDRPPAKRGFIVTGVTTLLGIGAAAVFAPGENVLARADQVSPDEAPGYRPWLSVASVAPMALPGGGGIQIAGTLR